MKFTIEVAFNLNKLYNTTYWGFFGAVNLI
jgi:hypothetical protein